MDNEKSLLTGGEMILYGTVGASYWGDSFTAADVAAALADHGKKDITVRINSGGGIAFDGVAIYSLLRAHSESGFTVTTVVDGIAASAASLIAMAGDVRQVRTGALLMIHDASGVTFGTARDHEKSAGVLNKISAQYCDVYAAKSGKSTDDVRAMMIAETWLSAQEAVSEGFATEALADEAEEKAAFDYRIYAHAPAELAAVMRAQKPGATAMAAAPILSPVALATQPKESSMKDSQIETGSGVETGNAAPQVKAWIGDFYAAAERSDVAIKDLNEIAARSDTLAAAQAALIDAMAARNADKPGSRPPAGVTADAFDKFVAGAEKALLAKAGLDGGEANEFSSYSMREMARASLETRGIRAMGLSPLAMVRQAFQPVMAAPGHHTTSDFPTLLGNVARKSLMRGYDEVDESFKKWTSRGTLPDFKESNAAGVGIFGDLKRVEQGAEYTYATLAESGAKIQLAKYGQMFAITWETVINDDLNALTKIPFKLGQSAKRTIGSLALGVLTGNPVMSDAVALFHASHGNLATGGGSALGSDSLQAAFIAMGKQKDRIDGKVSLNIAPAYLLVPKALEWVANELVSSPSKLGQSNPAIKNPLKDRVTVIADARLDDASATAWYLLADPNAADTVEVSYLAGHEQPETFEEEGFAVDGTRYKVRHCAGVNPLDWRGVYKGAGA